ncbi:sucrose transporter [Lichtheimia corymbifera JMRC:FSU:9682]|uniref:Sucrose transporter n=1 Tax=Lichtheimia corymbifera JMRC:FSU:9682 TaxID=1263082 RepID=A0A068RFJ5_9FUNG|nr:sucrose transporter [Lichtheimia corymbifera JMRC:FSU:9682]
MLKNVISIIPGTVELSYGTPYLLSLNLSKELTALVWLAGPLSEADTLLGHELIGAWSDKCTSKLGRRRPFIIIGSVLVCISLFCVGYAKEISRLLTSDEDNEARNNKLAIAIAVSSFYFLDFCLNAVQACCRSLFLDVFPISQQDTANAFGSNLGNLTNVFGYFIGYLDLVKYLPMLGNSQMGALCIAGILVFALSMTVTCLSVQEIPLSADAIVKTDEPWYQVFVYIWYALRRLPPSVQKLCNAQFFAWMGWFPFLFYSTTWVSEIYFEAHQPERWDEGTRAGSFALLMYAIVSAVAGTILPMLTNHGFLSLKNTYTLSHTVFATAMLLTFFIHSVVGATLLLGLVGVSWATTMWIPFALIGEYLVIEQQRKSQHLLQQRSSYAAMDGETSSSSSSPSSVVSSSSRTRVEEDEERGQLLVAAVDDTMDAGMVLGVHNMYVVFPQFAVAIIAALIFSVANAVQQTESPVDDERGNWGVPWVLRFGGMMAIMAIVLSRRVVDVDLNNKR